MMSWILSSSILILCVLGLRVLAGNRIPAGLRYGLWLLVLIRLLIPVPLGSSPASVSNIPAVQALNGTPYQEAPVIRQPEIEATERSEPEILPAVTVPPEPEKDWPAVVLITLWLAGSLSVGAFFLWSNLHFYRMLCLSRHRLPTKEKLPVYVTNRIESPCIFGLLRPCIYLTRESADDETMFRHTVVHEACHYRHGDHIWAVLRGICLAVHWYNPLVWTAAVLSQRDGELACDEAVIRTLGDRERAQYGRTLIQISCQKKSSPLQIATTMSADRNVLKQRISWLVSRKRPVFLVILAVVILACAFVSCTFTGPEEEKNQSLEGMPIFEKNNVEHLEIDVGSSVYALTGEYPERTAAQAWAWEFRYGEKIDTPKQPDRHYLEIAYEDGSRIQCGFDTVTVDGQSYRVERPDIPREIQTLLEAEQPSTSVTIPEAEIVQPRVEDHFPLDGYAIAVTLTGVSAEAGDYRYVVPKNQSEFERVFKNALSQAHTLEDYSPGHWVIVAEGEYWHSNQSGGLQNGSQEIPAEASRELLGLCQKELIEANVPQPVDPRTLHGIRKATLNWIGTASTSDPQDLMQIETWLTQASPISFPSCWFTATLTLELEDGSRKTLAMATDSCSTFMTEGVAYQYAVGDNTPFYSIFAGDILRENRDLTWEEVEELKSYVDLEAYARKYGQEAADFLSRRLGPNGGLPEPTPEQVQQEILISLRPESYAMEKAEDRTKVESEDRYPRGEVSCGTDGLPFTMVAGDSMLPIDGFYGFRFDYPDQEFTMTENIALQISEDTDLHILVRESVISPIKNRVEFGLINVKTGVCYGHDLGKHQAEQDVILEFPDLPQGLYRLYGFNHSGLDLKYGAVFFRFIP